MYKLTISYLYEWVVKTRGISKARPAEIILRVWGITILASNNI